MSHYKLMDNVIKFATKYSDDPGTKVGACLVVDGVHTFGTNRFYSLPEGMTKEEVVKDRTTKNLWITHAEVDAINHASKTVGGTIYVNYTPCDCCARKIAAAGIKKVVAPVMTDAGAIERWSKYWKIGQQVLRENGVEFVEE